MKPRLLVVEMHHLGDAVMALPFLRAAVKIYETTIFCHARTARLFAESVPGITVHPTGKWNPGGLPGLGRQDVAVCVWPDPRAHLAMMRSGAGRRIGYRLTPHNFYGADRPWRRRRLMVARMLEKGLSLVRPLLTEPLDRAPGGQTHDESWIQVARTLGLEPDHSFPWLPLPEAPPDFLAFASAVRAKGKKLLALHPGGRLPGKRWEITRFQALLKDYLPANNIAVAIIKPPGENFPSPQSGDQQIFESPSVSGLGAIFARTDGVLCNDSLASHLAAAVGIPVTTIFGSGDPAWFSPFGNAHFAVATEACPHRPCVDRCIMPSWVCLENISIHLVETKLSAMFANPFQKNTT